MPLLNIDSLKMNFTKLFKVCKSLTLVVYLWLLCPFYPEFDFFVRKSFLYLGCFLSSGCKFSLSMSEQCHRLFIILDDVAMKYYHFRPVMWKGKCIYTYIPNKTYTYYYNLYVLVYWFWHFMSNFSRYDIRKDDKKRAQVILKKTFRPSFNFGIFY